MLKRLGLAVLLLATAAAAERYDAASVSARWALDFYKANVSPLQGGAICNFEPTCSQFSKQAIDRYGLFRGLLMTADRLERCNPYAVSYYGTYYPGITNGRLNDPVDGWREAVASVPAGVKPGPKPVDGPSFAEYLLSRQDYDRAIGEFRRAAFTESVPGSRAYARFMVGECFLRKCDYSNAEAAFRDATTPENFELARLGLARSLLMQNRLPAAQYYAAGIAYPPLARSARVIDAWADFRQFRFAVGADKLRDYGGDSLLGPVTRLDGTGITRRNRAVSTLLSTVIPGLGQVYSDRTGDGGYSFLVVAAGAAASWYYWTHPEQDPQRVKFGIVAGLGTLFYLGNIYGANIAARDFNQARLREYRARVEEVLGRENLQPGYRSLLR